MSFFPFRGPPWSQKPRKTRGFLIVPRWISATPKATKHRKTRCFLTPRASLCCLGLWLLHRVSKVNQNTVNTAFFPFRGAPRTSRSFSSSNLAQLTPMLALACPYVGPICPLCCPSLDPMFTLSCPYVDPIWLLSWPYLGLRLPRVVDPSIACPYVSPILPLWWPYLSPMLPRAYLSSMLPLAWPYVDLSSYVDPMLA